MNECVKKDVRVDGWMAGWMYAWWYFDMRCIYLYLYIYFCVCVCWAEHLLCWDTFAFSTSQAVFKVSSKRTRFFLSAFLLNSTHIIYNLRRYIISPCFVDYQKVYKKLPNKIKPNNTPTELESNEIRLRNFSFSKREFSNFQLLVFKIKQSTEKR